MAIQFSSYLHLIRWYAPVGTLLLMWPPLWCLFLLSDSWPPVDLITIFILGAFVMRSAGCVINDITDRKLDALVERTQNRPLASGAIPVSHAWALLALLFAVALAMAFYLGMKVVLASIPAAILVMLYPWMKRITFWPQLFLGITFNYGVLLASIALTGAVQPAAWWLYASAMFWTLGYDTIYGFQDIKDDEKIGIKSTSRLFKNHAKLAVGMTYGMSTLCFCIAMLLIDKIGQHGVTLAILVLYFAHQVRGLEIHDSQKCLELFRFNGLWFGPAILLLLVI